MEQKEKGISLGSLEEIRAHNARREGRPSMDLERLNEAFKKADPDGKLADRLADRYQLCDFFLKFCQEGKLGEEVQDILKSFPELGPVNYREKVRRLVQRVVEFTLMDMKERQALIQKGGWSKE